MKQEALPLYKVIFVENKRLREVCPNVEAAVLRSFCGYMSLFWAADGLSRLTLGKDPIGAAIALPSILLGINQLRRSV